MAKTVDLRRHTDNDGDVLTAQGVGAAVEIGRGLAGDYHLAVSTGAQRATQALACMLAGHGRGVPGGVVVEPGLRSGAEDRWRAIAGKASGGGLASFRAVDAEFVDEEARLLGLALRRVFDSLDDGEVALVVGHSPTNEAAVLGLTGRIIDPLGKGEGVRVVSDGGFTISPLSDAPHTLKGPIVKSRFSSVHDHDSADPAYAADLKVALDTIVDDMQIPGAVVLIRSESKGDWSGTTGTRRLGTDEPVTIDDHFRVGSNTKTMTGTVVLQLVEEGDIDLDDPVSQYRPEVPNGDNITLAMLLEMRSGLSNFSADEGFNARLDNEPSHAWDPSELLAVAFAHEPSFDPGADFEYSNTNTVLLGLIIEQRTNLSLKEAFQQRIFDRLDLDHTLLPAPDDASIPSPHPRGYMFGTNVSTLADAALPAAEQAAAASGDLLPTDYTDSNPSWAGAAGGAISTAADLARYVEALVDGGLLGPRLQEIRLASIKPAGSDPGAAGYGYGIAKFGPMIGHDGQLPGFNSFMGRDPDERNTVIVLTSLFAGANGEQPANEMARAIIAALYQ